MIPADRVEVIEGDNETPVGDMIALLTEIRDNQISQASGDAAIADGLNAIYQTMSVMLQYQQQAAAAVQEISTLLEAFKDQEEGPQTVLAVSVKAKDLVNL